MSEHIQRSAKNLGGQTFGRWTVLYYVSTDKHFNQKWRCRCSCGKEKDVSIKNILRGISLSCGCMRIESQEKHGQYKTPEYKTWMNIKTRCLNNNTPYYKNYGARGITVCDQWKKSFECFLSDMGKRPSKLHSIERKDNNKGYSPDNCVWATKEDQQHNIRIQQNNTSGSNGISFHNKIKRFIASITVKGKHKYIGCFKTLEEAIKARNVAEKQFWNKEI